VKLSDVKHKLFIEDNSVYVTIVSFLLYIYMTFIQVKNITHIFRYNKKISIPLPDFGLLSVFFFLDEFHCICFLFKIDTVF